MAEDSSAPIQISETKSNNQLPCIEVTSVSSNISEHSHVSILVRGETLDECRKHFDEIKKEVEL